MNTLVELFNSLSLEAKAGIVVALVAAVAASQVMGGGSSKKKEETPKVAKKEPALHKEQFRKFRLREKQIINHNTRLFRFELPNPDDVLGLPIGQHISLKTVVDGKDVYRSYTPVSSDDERGYFDLLIKVYEKGNMTQYLEKMQIGDLLEVRGPKGQFVYSKGMHKNIGMLAGGTGITPMLQVARAILKDTSDDTQLNLIFANINEDDILLREELDQMTKKYHNFHVYYVLNNAPEGWKGGVGFVNQDMIKANFAPPTEDVKIVLCGPPMMNKAMTAHLQALGYAEDQMFQF